MPSQLLARQFAVSASTQAPKLSSAMSLYAYVDLGTANR